jgi:hypothetical protein
MTTSSERSCDKAEKQSSSRLISVILLGAVCAAAYFINKNEAFMQSDIVVNLFTYGKRVLIIIFSLVIWFWTQTALGKRKTKDGIIDDAFHRLTAPVNQYFHKNSRHADLVLILSSAFIDIFGIFLICASIFGNSFRPFVAMLIVYASRQSFQAICALPVPDGMIWRSPGVPSLLVTYDVGNDFFFSGHTCIAVIATIELFHLNIWLGIAAAVIALLEMTVVIVLRAHYTMDVFTAILAAIGAFYVASIIC